MPSLNFKFVVYLCVFLFFFKESFTQTAANFPRGRIEKCQFKESKIFPGTIRDITIYIPQQIDPSVPSCVYIQQDGINSNTAAVLDSLIDLHQIPVMVGIFVGSGYIPDGQNHDIRPNRSYEYDGLGDKYARFLLEEILPFVTNKYNLNLSNKANDRAIGGGSSGGIAAFNAAWERPDAFSRVYSNSGSFVAFRGGHEFPVLVRKTEAKPIRAYFTTGTNDMENAAGDWTLIDQEMDKALKFAGYDYKFKVIEGRHIAGYRDQFAEPMLFIWKGWPEQVKAGPSAPRVQDILLPGEGWQLASQDFVGLSPAVNSNGEVYFIDIKDNRICKIKTDGQVIVFLKNSKFGSGLSFGSNGNLYSVSEKTGKVISIDSTGKERIYATGIYGRYILAKPDSSFYITEPRTGRVWLLKNSKKSVVDSGLRFPTGLAISPDRWLLAVAERQSHWVYSYTIDFDGKLINKENLFWLHVPDSKENSQAEPVCYDKEGHLYVGTNYGIQVCAWDGATQVILPLPNKEAVKGICIGGVNFDTLFVFCEDKIYKRKIKNHGIGAFSPWTKMTRSKL